MFFAAFIIGTIINGIDYTFQVMVAGARTHDCCFKKESPEVLFNFYILFFNFLNVRYFKQSSRRSDIMNPAPVHWVSG